MRCAVLLGLVLYCAMVSVEAMAKKRSGSRGKKRYGQVSPVPKIQVAIPDFIRLNAGPDATFGLPEGAEAANRLLSSAPGGASSSGSGGMSSAGGRNGNLYFDESAAKGDAGGGGRGGLPPAGRGQGDPGESVSFPLWYPICLFIDESENNGNAAVKGVVDMGASCGVNVVVFAVTTKGNYPNSSGSINSMAQNACNIIEAGIASKASVSTCVKYADTAGEMCGDPPEKRPSTAGCAQLGGGGGGDKKMITRMQSSGHFGGKSEDGKPVPSIERSGSCNAGIVAHESQGHSQFGWPNGSGAGNGIGTPSEGEEGGGGGGDGWTGAGCGQMRATSLKNDGGWSYNPKQQIYYIKETDPEKMWDLTDSSRKLFGGPPPGGDKPPPLRIGEGRIDPLDPNFFMVSDPKNGGKTATVAGDLSNPPTGEGLRHKRKKGGDALISQLTALLKNSGTSVPKTIDESSEGSSIPAEKSAGSTGAELFFDESAKKGASSPSATVETPASSPKVSLSGGSANANGNLVFDESAKKGGGGGVSSVTNPATGTATGGGGGMGNSMGPLLSGVGKTSSSMDDSFFNEKPGTVTPNARGKRQRGEALRQPASVRTAGGL